jgi:hypothetical protein
MNTQPMRVTNDTSMNVLTSKPEAPIGLLSRELARYPSQAAAIAAMFAEGGKKATVKSNPKLKNTFKILADEVDAYEMRRRMSSASSSSSSEGMRRAVGMIENHPWFFGYQTKVDTVLEPCSPTSPAQQFVNHPLYEPFDFDDELIAAKSALK